MRVVEQVFELILRLYPSNFRRHYGDEMRGFVRARLGEPRYASPWGAALCVAVPHSRSWQLSPWR